MKYLKIQRKMFRSPERELAKGEYLRLLETADALGKVRLRLLIETICATGIRVSEVKYITVETVQAGCTDIALKGKIRTILLPRKLCRKLQKYAKKQKITSGEIFLTRSGRGISRRQIWAEMKALCRKAGVPQKYFPTICGTCSRGPSTAPAGMWRSWRMCWGTPVSKLHVSTLSPLESNTPGRSNGWALFLDLNKTEYIFCNKIRTKEKAFRQNSLHAVYRISQPKRNCKGKVCFSRDK